VLKFSSFTLLTLVTFVASAVAQQQQPPADLLYMLGNATYKQALMSDQVQQLQRRVADLEKQLADAKKLATPVPEAAKALEK